MAYKLPNGSKMDKSPIEVKGNPYKVLAKAARAKTLSKPLTLLTHNLNKKENITKKKENITGRTGIL